MKVEHSITKTNMICWMTTIFLLTVCFMVFFIYQKYSDINQIRQQLKLAEERHVDDVLREEVDGALRLIAAIRDSKTQAVSEEELERVLKMFQEIAPEIGPRGDIHLIAADGKLLSAPEGSLLAGEKTSGSKNIVISGIPKSLPAVKASSGELYVKIDTKSVTGAKVRWHAKACPYLPLVVCATRDMRGVEKAVSANINHLKFNIVMETSLILILAAAVTLIAICIAYGTSNVINAEVGNLKKRCEMGLREEVAVSADNFHFHEFGTISEAIATMTSQIRGLLAELKNTAVQSTIAKQIRGGVLSNVSHDLLSSLNGIMGMAQILRTEQKSESERRYCIDTIMDSGKAIMTLIKNVDYAVVLDTKKFQPSLRILKVKDLQDDIIRMIGHVIRGRNNELEWVCGQDVPVGIVSDQNLLGQILINLIEVGLYRSCKSPMKIELANQGVSGTKVSLMFGIELKGAGLTQSELDEVLHFPYVPREYATAGLRLAICNRLTELLGGKFEVKTVNSQDLVATLRFEATLPKAEMEPSASEETSEPVAEENSVLKALVVDDEPVNREVTSLMLKYFGLEAMKACNGQEALGQIEKFPGFNIVFMDCQMPVMDGYAAVREIRRRGSGRRLTVVALTGYNTPLDEQLCIEAGMDGYMSKPLIMEELKTTLKKFSMI